MYIYVYIYSTLRHSPKLSGEISVNVCVKKICLRVASPERVEGKWSFLHKIYQSFTKTVQPFNFNVLHIIFETETLSRNCLPKNSSDGVILVTLCAIYISSCFPVSLSLNFTAAGQVLMLHFTILLWSIK